MTENDPIIDALLHEHARRGPSPDTAFLERVEKAIARDRGGRFLTPPVLTAAAAVLTALIIVILSPRTPEDDVVVKWKLHPDRLDVFWVSFVGNSAYSSQELGKMMTVDQQSLRPAMGGMNNDFLEDDIRTIEKRYRDDGYLDAAVVDARRIRKGPKRVDLQISIEEGPRYTIGGITLNGLTRYAPGDLTPLLKTQAGNVASRAVIDQDLKTIENYYGERGYVDAKVKSQVVAMASGAAEVSFVVEEGERILIKEINIPNNESRHVIRQPLIIFEGNTAFSDRTLLAQCKGGKLTEDDLRAIESYYRDRGYLNARIAEESAKEANLLSASPVIKIEEGQKFVVGEVKIEGATRYNSADLFKVVSTSQGQTFSAKQIEKDLKQLGDFYGERGYTEARVIPNLDGKEGEPVRVTYTIVEGEKIALRNINIAGNDRTKDHVIRQELAVAPAEVAAWTQRARDARLATPEPISGEATKVNLSTSAGSRTWEEPRASSSTFNFGDGVSVIDGDQVPNFERQFLGGANNLRGFSYQLPNPSEVYSDAYLFRNPSVMVDGFSTSLLEKTNTELAAEGGSHAYSGLGGDSSLPGAEELHGMSIGSDYVHDTRDDLFLPRNNLELYPKSGGATRVDLTGYVGIDGVDDDPVDVIRTQNPIVTTSLPEQRDMISGEAFYAPRTVTARDINLGVEGRSAELRNLIRENEASMFRFRATAQALENERYNQLVDNPWLNPQQDPLSTFSIDVDTGSYTNLRRLITSGQPIPKDAVRVEEMINYFTYNYPQPKGEHPIAVAVESAICPWDETHQLMRIGLHAKSIPLDQRPDANLVLLLDVSGSMGSPDKLPLVIQSVTLLVEELRKNDKLSIVVYAGSRGLALKPTAGDQHQTILNALNRLQAGGSTNGGEGIELAYQLAQDNFIPGGINRVILCTDGDFNVGVTGQGELVTMVKERAQKGVFLSVMGYGTGNLNDAMLESITRDGNGVYYYIDSILEARKVFLEETMSTLLTVAKDVKLQIEFNPAKVQSYRLIGYANRMLRKEDFQNDKVDAGDVGAGHTVTAFYEIVPAGVEQPSNSPATPASAPALRYQSNTPTLVPSEELAVVKLRYKQPDGDASLLIEAPVAAGPGRWREASDDFQFSAGVALFGMVLRDPALCGNARLADVVKLAKEGIGADEKGMRREFLDLVNTQIIAANAKKEPGTVAAVVNGDVINVYEVRAAAQMQLQMIYMQEPHMTKEQFERRARELQATVLDDMIDRKLILQEFKEMGAAIRQEHIDESVNRFIRERFENDRAKFMSELDKNGLTFKQFRKHQEETIIIQAMRARNAGGDDEVITAGEVEQYWSKHPEYFSKPGFVKLRTITIPKLVDGEAATADIQKKLIDEIVAKLRAGADFGEMARAYSVDSGKSNAGERGTFAKEDLNGALAETAFKIAVKTVSDPVDMGDFYTVIWVEEREDVKAPTLAEVREEVTKRILDQRRQEKVDAWLKRLRANAVIKIIGG